MAALRQNILYGIHPIREAIRAGRALSRLYVLSGRRDPKTEALIQDAKAMGSSVQFESRSRLDQLAQTIKHQGLVAFVGAQETANLDKLIEQFKSSPDREWPPLLVILDEVEDPHNLGAVIRTSEAAGAHGIVIPERRSAGLTPAVAKSSAGALSHLPIVQVGNLRNSMSRVKKAGLWVMGLDAKARTPYWTIDWRMPVAIVAGAEGKGLRPLVRDECDQLVSLPMRGKVNSLNVSVSVGIILYEIVRQRRENPSTPAPS